MLIGKDVTLREIRREDLTQMQAWRNNPELRHHFREFRPLTELNQELWFDKIVTQSNEHLSFAITYTRNGQLIGYAGLNYINWQLSSGEFGIYLAPKDALYDCRSKGYGKEALLLLMDYGFQEVGLRKIWAEVFSFNKALNLYKKIGYQQDGILRDNCIYKGEYHDSIIVSMFKSEYTQKYLLGKDECKDN